MTLPIRNLHDIICLKRSVIVFLLFFSTTSVALFGQNVSSFGFKSENKNKLSKHQNDSIFNSNPLCQRYAEVVKLDTIYWNQYSPMAFDSITQLRGITANELAKKVLDITLSDFYSKNPFNLLGTYRETEMRDNANTSQNIKTKVKVYDPGFTGNRLPTARTEKCDNVSKSPNFPNSVLGMYKTTLGGLYSNLYLTLDFDFLRMYNFPYSSELGGDRRIWSSHNFNPRHVSDDYKYYKAYIKDSSIYVVLVSTRKYSVMDRVLSPGSGMKVIENKPVKDTPRDVLKEFKYLLVNLKTNAIEKTGYYEISLPDSSYAYPNMAHSYETSYKLIDGKYYLDQVSNNEFLFGPRICHISLSGISFKVDSVVAEPKKVEKIRDYEADPRKESYFDQNYLKATKLRNNRKD